MTSLTSALQTNMADSSLFTAINTVSAAYSVVSATSSAIQIRANDNSSGHIISGSFTYDGTGALSGGTVTGYQITDASFANTYVSMGAGSFNILTLQSYLQANDAAGLLGFIFSGADSISSSAFNDTILGYGGGDWLHGYAGNDAVYGGNGVADPNDGNDTLYGGSGNDSIFGNSGDDVIYGGNDVADSTDGADTIYGGKGADTIYGNSGNDYIAGGGSSVDPLDQADLIYGGKGSDEIYGNGSNDTLYGGGASADPLDEADVIYGGAGDDLIFGNGGNDSLYGNEGNDTFYGGVGDDVHVFGAGSGTDMLMQFDSPGVAGGDVVAVASGINGFTSAAALAAAVSYIGGNAVLDLGSGNSITIAGIASGLTADDFLII